MTQPVASPCINVCTMDDTTGWCAGCLRTLDEIACWTRLGESEKQQVCVELSRRRVQWRRLHPAAAQSGGAA